MFVESMQGLRDKNNFRLRVYTLKIVDKVN